MPFLRRSRPRLPGLESLEGRRLLSHGTFEMGAGFAPADAGPAWRPGPSLVLAPIDPARVQAAPIAAAPDPDAHAGSAPLPSPQGPEPRSGATPLDARLRADLVDQILGQVDVESEPEPEPAGVVPALMLTSAALAGAEAVRRWQSRRSTLRPVAAWAPRGPSPRRLV